MYLIFLFLIGPKIYLEPEWIDFKKIDLGNDDIASVELVNNTNVPATYQVGVLVLVNKFSFLY